MPKTGRAFLVVEEPYTDETKEALAIACWDLALELRFKAERDMFILIRRSGSSGGRERDGRREWSDSNLECCAFGVFKPLKSGDVSWVWLRRMWGVRLWLAQIAGPTCLTGGGNYEYGLRVEARRTKHRLYTTPSIFAPRDDP